MINEEEIASKYPAIDPDYVRAIVRLKNNNINRRFLTSNDEVREPRIGILERLFGWLRKGRG